MQSINPLYRGTCEDAIGCLSLSESSTFKAELGDNIEFLGSEIEDDDSNIKDDDYIDIEDDEKQNKLPKSGDCFSKCNEYTRNRIGKLFGTFLKK